jgi:hypothetical protein
VRRALAPFQDRGQERFRLEGPETRINADKSLLLAMALHERATNAVKCGSLSNQAGEVSVRWEAMYSPQGPQLKLEWRESGGPAVAPPSRKGFGTGACHPAHDRRLARRARRPARRRPQFRHLGRRDRRRQWQAGPPHGRPHQKVSDLLPGFSAAPSFPERTKHLRRGAA